MEETPSNNSWSSHVDRELVRARLVEILAYLASAARGNVDEAAGYGPYRLMEGILRVIRILRDFGFVDDELNDIADDLTTNAMKIIGDKERARETADRILRVASERLSDEGVGGSGGN